MKKESEKVSEFTEFGISRAANGRELFTFRDETILSLSLFLSLSSVFFPIELLH